MSGRRLTCWRAGLAGLGALVLAVTVSGCGTDTTVPRAPLNNTKTLALVTPQDIARTAPGSPQRTVLTWWRFTQYTVVDDALALFTPKARTSLERAHYRTTAVQNFGPWIRNEKPQIGRVEYPHRDHSVVYMKTVFNTPVGHDLVRQFVDTLAFSLDRRGGAWLISDPSWMISQTAQIRGAAQTVARARRQARRRP